ncbi:MAG: nicotinamide-nucleotide amidohydrolase family protein [Bacilli bacterium]|nr:nicotinamide-nucleotide amidohydrolase family protein [Bacilli bacterium]
MNLEKIVERLTEEKMTISSMESCTGGCFCNSLTNVEGASLVFKFSAITYSNEYKIKFGVKKSTIDKYSVYSFEVADEMSYNISKYADSDIGIGITGKLNRADVNNMYGEDNVVFISVYDKGKDKFYHKIVVATLDNRVSNKELVVKEVSLILEKILG